MATITRLVEQPEPPLYLRDRPRDARGYVIPFIVLMRPDGTPDFRVTDTERWLECVRGRLCALCGVLMMGHYLYFIGGPLSVESSLLFTDPAMHENCARYALKVCPFLAAPRARYRELTEADVKNFGAEVSVSQSVLEKRPEKFGLLKVKSYAVAKAGDEYFIQARDVVSLEWFEYPH